MDGVFKRATECTGRYAAIGALTFGVESFYLCRRWPSAEGRLSRSLAASVAVVAVVFTTDVVYRVAEEE